MARRYVKTTKTDSLGEITPQVTAIVSTKNNIQSESKAQSYFKRNYMDAISKLIPKLYFDDEERLSGTQVPFTHQQINSHIEANQQQATILPVSSLAADSNLSSVGTPDGFARFFYNQNSPATISPDDFERNILKPLGKVYDDFTSSGEFVDYVSSTLLPSIPVVGTTDIDLAALTTSAFAVNSSGTHAYLINNIGWLYFLNREGPVGG